MPGASNALDERRLRGGLRLFLPADRAEVAAERMLGAADPLTSLRQLAGDLARERQVSRIVTRLSPRRGLSGARPPCPVPNAVQPRAVLALLAHVGLGVDGEQLEDAFGVDSHDIGRDLLQARAAFSARPITACHEYGWVIGRYRDRELASDERVRLLSHARACDVCRAALEQALQADVALLDALDRQLEQLPARRTAVRSGRSGPRFGAVAVAVSALIALLAMVVVLSLIGTFFAEPDSPVPLFIGDAAAIEPLDGWLLQVSPVGYLEGVNLATGQKRGLDSGGGGNVSPLYRVSRTHLAAWMPSDGQRDDVLTIGPIGEQVDFRLTWNRQFVYWYPSGWLDDDTLLIVKSPERVSGETEQRYTERLFSQSRLIAFDAVTGAEQVLMTGNVAAAYPSPDGTMLAILHPIDRRWPGNTLELRPFDGQTVGAPVVQIEHRVTTDGIWLADSSRFVTSVIADQSVSMGASTRGATLAEHGVQRVELVGINRDGEWLALASADAPETIVPIAASPDSRSILYQVRADRTEPMLPGVAAYDWRCYRLPSIGGDPVLLTAGSSPERIFKPAWSPDGSTLILPVTRAFPLSTDGRIDQPISPNATALLVYDRRWRPGTDPQVIYSSGRDLYGWLPPGSLEPRAGLPNDDGRSLAAVESVEQELDQLSINSRSVAAGDGEHMVVSERESRVLLIWNVGGDRQRRLDGNTTDLAWFNRGTATIGVESEPDGENGSRIVLNVADISNSAAYLDYRSFDPAIIGDAINRRYAVPLVSPSGTVISFFVVDRRSGIVSLWLDDDSGPAQVVAEWTLPPDRVIEPPAVASWVRSDTLLFTRPAGWKDGMPQAAVLMRVAIDPGAGVRVDELVRLDTIHGAQGVVLAELALSPDATQLAYRLRHYASASANSAADDTLHVAGTDDLGRAIELERGGYGAGLFWTSDGDRVGAGVGGRIALYSPDGRDLQYLSPRGVESTYPILVGEQIWFEAVDNRGGSIWRVDLE